MDTPMWQYIALVLIFSLGAILNVTSVGLMVFLEKVKPEVLTKKQAPLGVGSLLFKTLVAVFAAYLSYSLYLWAPGALGLGILIVHWSSIVVRYIVGVVDAGKEKIYTYGQHFFGAAYSSAMLIALIVYGVKCL